jgi:hypothetical protein
MELQLVYRTAKALDQQMKGGADQEQLRSFRANLATEPGVVLDKMKRTSSLERLLRPHYTNYDAVLRSYSLVLDVSGYHDRHQRCIGPRYETRNADRRNMSIEEQVADLSAADAFIRRIRRCNEADSAELESLHSRAKQLGMNCPKFDWDSGCLASFASSKLAHAEIALLNSR